MQIIFDSKLGLKRPTEYLIKAICYARLSCSKQSWNEVIFIWFTLDALNTLNDRLYASTITKIAKCFFHMTMTK